MAGNQILSAIRAAGIVGQGGAGFPTHVKLATTVDILIANGCECEPLLYSDQRIMHDNAELLVLGMHAAMEACRAKLGIIALKRKHSALIDRLRQAMAGSSLELCLLDNFYPAGDEQVLVYEATGKSVPPFSLPGSVGCAVSNVGTLVAIAESLQGKAVGEKMVTVTGDVARPAVFSVPVGTSVASCILHCGGASISAPAVILGGPMMGKVITTHEALSSAVVTKTLGGIIVIPQEHYLARASRQNIEVMRRRAASACIQCRYCSELCPRYLIGHPFETHRVMRAFANGLEIESPAVELAGMCCECGVCEHVSCPMQLSPCSVNKAIKRGRKSPGTGRRSEFSLVPEQTQWSSYRKTPVSRLSSRIGITGYREIQPEYVPGFEPETVNIPLQQHIGHPAVPVCKVGDRVCKGDVLAEIPENALGARVHASLSGVVEQVDNSIRIRRV